jgi:nicotinamidase-related amidase
MLSRNSAVLIVIDMQGNLFQAMHDKDNLLINAVKVIKGAVIFNLPIIVTEQVPQKLGPTIAPVAGELNDFQPVGKENFSCWENKKFREKLEAFSRNNVIILGIECHVCVYQTAADLIENGYIVHVVADAVASRTRANNDIGLVAMKSRGAQLTSAEMVLFELLRTAADPRSRDLFKIVK